MSENKFVITEKKAKKDFNRIGFLLILYCLLVLIAPNVVIRYLEMAMPELINDEIVYFGIIYITLLLGSFVPFFVMARGSKIKAGSMFKIAEISFFDIIIHTMVFFTYASILIFISNVLANQFGKPGTIVSSIGIMVDSSLLTNNLYAFMFVFVSPLLEEYCFRGVLLNSLGKYGKRFALYASAIMFALAHNSFLDMLPSLAIGIFLGMNALRYESIQPSIAIHIAFNLFIYLLVILPESINRYMTFGLTVIYIISTLLIVSRIYQNTKIVAPKNQKSAFPIFFSCFNIILAVIVFIGHSLLFVYL